MKFRKDLPKRSVKALLPCCRFVALALAELLPFRKVKHGFPFFPGQEKSPTNCTELLEFASLLFSFSDNILFLLMTMKALYKLILVTIYKSCQVFVYIYICHI